MTLIEANGVLVEKGSIAVSGFLREVVARDGGVNRKFDGSFDDLIELASASLENYTPGVGSKDGDVRLVRVPTAGFYTDIVAITDANAADVRITWKSRVEGEARFSNMIIEADSLTPASSVELVLYRADTLAKDNNRSSDAEWEIVAILANPSDEIPMTPVTMARNALHLSGGTHREYSNEEWASAVEFWQRHASIVVKD